MDHMMPGVEVRVKCEWTAKWMFRWARIFAASQAGGDCVARSAKREHRPSVHGQGAVIEALPLNTSGGAAAGGRTRAQAAPL